MEEGGRKIRERAIEREREISSAKSIARGIVFVYDLRTSMYFLFQ